MKAATYNHSEIIVRNAKAKHYSRRCRKAKIRKMVKRFLITGIAISGTIAALLFMAAQSEPRYAIASERGEIHYEYVTERKCEVTNVSGKKVTVAYKGNLYAFYGEGYKVGDKLICKFTDSMEIVDTELIN